MHPLKRGTLKTKTYKIEKDSNIIMNVVIMKWAGVKNNNTKLTIFKNHIYVWGNYKKYVYINIKSQLKIKIIRPYFNTNSIMFVLFTWFYSIPLTYNSIMMMLMWIWQVFDRTLICFNVCSKFVVLSNIKYFGDFDLHKKVNEIML